MNTAMRRIRI
jgi:hypothetical protein